MRRLPILIFRFCRSPLRRRYRHDRFDIVHAHFGLTAWPALAARGRARVLTLHGTDLAHPRSRPVTLAALRLRWSRPSPSRWRPRSRGGRSEIARPAAAARRAPAEWRCSRVASTCTGSPGSTAPRRAGGSARARRPYLLFAADPRRPEKRHDLALAVAGDVELLTLGAVPPQDVPLLVNAANAVLAPSDREGFGLAVLEALACDVPVLATPVGIAPEALAGVAGTLCAPFDAGVWRAALATHLADADPRVAGRGVAERYSSDAMAARVLSAWRGLLAAAGAGAGGRGEQQR